LYPKPGKDDIDLVEKVLRFNPNDRLDITEIVKHKYFDEVRDQELEDIVEKGPIVLPFDEEEDLTVEKLRGYFVKEIYIITIENHLENMMKLCYICNNNYKLGKSSPNYR